LVEAIRLKTGTPHPMVAHGLLKALNALPVITAEAVDATHGVRIVVAHHALGDQEGTINAVLVAVRETTRIDRAYAATSKRLAWVSALAAVAFHRRRYAVPCEHGLGDGASTPNVVGELTGRLEIKFFAIGGAVAAGPRPCSVAAA